MDTILAKATKRDRSPHSGAQNSTPSVNDGFEAGVEPSLVVTPQNGGSVEVGIHRGFWRGAMAQKSVLQTVNIKQECQGIS